MKEFFKNFGAALLGVFYHFVVMVTWVIFILVFFCIGDQTPWIAVLLFIMNLILGCFTIFLTILTGMLARGKWILIGKDETILTINNKEEN